MSADVKAARDLLEFYVAAGVDAVLAEEPVDRFADAEAIPPARPADDPTRSVLRTDHPPLSGEGRRMDKGGGSQPPSPVLLPPDAAAAEAREAARNAKTLDELREILAGFEGCALKAS